MTRPKPAVASSPAAPAPAAGKRAGASRSTTAALAVNPPASAPQNGDRLLEALKEELFQLEMERHQGKISGEDYEKAKSALDTTLARAAKRAGA